ncbi:MAG: linear amide C-N hydrolase [Rhodobacteraceae bacterium]|nr:linear amide C-N hydrolase [Paracoccaceae bacterium]
MDFEKKPDAAYVYFMPRGEDYVPQWVRDALATADIYLYKPEKKNLYSFVGAANEFGIAGLNHTQTRIFADGLNEKGISVSMQWLPDSKFPYLQSDANKDNRLFLNWYMASYILGNIASLDEIPGLFAGANPTFKVFEIDHLFGKAVSLPFHFNVQDAEGNSMIIEFEGEPGAERGAVKLYDSRDAANPFLKASGALTNYPFYSEQVADYELFLNNHKGISPVNKEEEPGQPQEVNGSGLLGMPGDGTPVSRFARTHLLMKTVYTNPESDMDAVGAAIQMLGNIAVPIGTIAPFDEPTEVGDSTLWSAVRDHKNLKYYYYDQHNNQLRMINLAELVNETAIKSIVLELKGNNDWYYDTTSELKS